MKRRKKTILFFAPEISPLLARKYFAVMKVIKKNGWEISFMLAGQEKISLPSATKRELQSKGLSSFYGFDCLILDMSVLTANVRYALAQAIVFQQPTLCLYKNSSPPRDILAILHHPHVPPSIKTHPLPSRGITNLILSFLNSV